jgi:hypothetical protein
VAVHAPANFSGAWVTQVTPAAGGANTTAAVVSARGGTTAGSWSRAEGPIEERLVQTVDTLTVERRAGGGRQKYVYKLDGTESVNVNGRSTRTTKSHWDGETLVTQGRESTAGARTAIVNTFREARSMDNTGAMLVEATRQFEGSGQTVTAMMLVKKK